MRAERDPEMPPARRREPRLAVEIALGIWMGGMALCITWAVLGVLVMGSMAKAIRFG